jgi:hypothetical protein
VRERARRRDDGGVLDGAALHAVPGQAVGVLDVLGDIRGGQRPQRAGVGFDQQALLARLEHCAARAVVDVGEAVVASADDPVADRHRDRPVVDVDAEPALRSGVRASGGIKRRARVVVAGDQHCLGGAVLAGGAPPTSGPSAWCRRGLRST